jgi:hypothetical protein
VDAAPQLVGEADHVVVRERVDEALRLPGLVDLLELRTQDVRREVGLHVAVDLLAELVAAQPRWTSRICPTFMREGTPSGLSTMSTGVPSSRYGMSSSGRIREMTPLLPWRPAILSPTCSLRLMAT